MSFFRFHHFTVHQTEDVHRVGTDGLVLGAWTQITAGPILDVGTGTGLLALMLAQRSHERIDAIDCNPAALKQAHVNIIGSPWAEHIQLYHSRLQDWTPTYRYGMLICNPPFYAGPLHAPAAGRDLARHHDALPHEILLSEATRLLLPSGFLNLILPLEPAQQLLSSAHDWQLTRRWELAHSPTHVPKRLLLTLQRPPYTALCTQGRLCLRDENGAFSADYWSLAAIYHSPSAPPGQHPRHDA